MEVVLPDVELITESNYAKKIEICGRVCYKSEDKITETSSKKMIKYLMQEKHTSVFEHYRVVIETSDLLINLKKNRFVDKGYDWSKYKHVYSTNFRALIEIFDNYDPTDDPFQESEVMLEVYHQLQKQYPIVFSKEMVYPEDLDEGSVTIYEDPDYATFRITCDRSISHQIVRHRAMSFSQESQRYCNYGKKGLKIIESGLCGWRRILLHSAVRFSELVYNGLLKCKVKPQQARLVLPNITKTEIMVTARREDWDWFLHLRADEKHADPRIVVIARKIKEILKEKVC